MSSQAIRGGIAVPWSELSSLLTYSAFDRVRLRFHQKSRSEPEQIPALRQVLASRQIDSPTQDSYQATDLVGSTTPVPDWRLARSAQSAEARTATPRSAP